MSRRNLIRGAATLGVLGALGQGGRAAAAESKPRRPLKQGAVVVFQGDSITDAHRNRSALKPNDAAGMGRGYAAMASGAVLMAHPGKEIQCYNRGISGNKIPDLAARWDTDVIDLKPDVLSILVGVNDLWHQFAFGSKYKATIKDYEDGYRDLIEKTQNARPDCLIVICEPFTTRRSDDFKPLADYGVVAKKLADECKRPFVPFQSVFNEAVKSAPANFWLTDGIHPTSAGHALMAKAWCEAVGI